MEINPITKWTYSTEEWNEFVSIERYNKKEDSIYFGIGIVILGTLGLMFLRGVSIFIGLLFSIPLAILIPLLRMKFSYKHLKKGVADPTVKFFPDHIKINTHKIELISSIKRIKSIKIIDIKNSQKKLIEFDIQWVTRKGPTNDEFRFLIPKNKQVEAEKMRQSYSNFS